MPIVIANRQLATTTPPLSRKTTGKEKGSEERGKERNGRGMGRQGEARGENRTRKQKGGGKEWNKIECEEKDKNGKDERE